MTSYTREIVVSINNLADKLFKEIDRNPIVVFVLLLIILNLSGLGADPNRLTNLAVFGFFVSAPVNFLVKLVFRDARPTKEKHRIVKYGFPSGHSQVIFTTAFVYSYYAPVFTVPFFLAAAIVSASRVKVRAHRIRDVIAGCVLGIISGLITVTLF